MTASVADSVATALRTTADGYVLDLGTFRWTGAWFAGTAFCSAVAVAFYVWFVSVLPTFGPLPPVALLAFETPVLLFVALAIGMAVAATLRVGRWSFSVSESGIRVVRGTHPPRDYPWNRIGRIRWGPVAVRVSRYRTDLAAGIWIDVSGRPTLRLDTARFRVRASDVDAMARALREAAVRHGTPVAPFPMMGQDRF